MADETAYGGSLVPPSVLDGFRGNKVYGRLITTELPSPPPKLLTRKPGRCSEPLEKAQKEYEEKSLLDKLLTPKDAWGNPKDQLGPKLFKQQCEQWPDQLPESFVDEQQQRLNDHLSGGISLPPEESLRLRRDLSLINDIYRPGPRYEASLSAAEQAWLDERNLRFGNSLSMALLGPIFGGPAAVTRALGGTEQQVAAANQMGAIVLDLATTRMAMQRRTLEPVPVRRQTYGLYIGPKPPRYFRPERPVSMSDAHSANTIKPKTRFGKGQVKTIAKANVDTKAELDMINRGEGKLLDNGDIMVPSGRIYGTHPGSDTIFLRGGPDTVQLTQAEFGIYTRMLENGGLSGSALRMMEGYISSSNGGINPGSQARLQDLFSSRGP